MTDKEDLVDDHRVYFKVKRVCFPVAVFLSCVLLVVCITLAVLFSQAVDEDTSHGVERPGKKYKICKEDRCFDLGKEIVHNMNQSVDPCQDFYAYACGGWQQRHPLKKGQLLNNSINWLTIKNLRIVKQAIEKASLNYSKNVAVMKTVRYYNSCMNTSAIASQGLRPLINLTAKYGGWSWFGNYDPNISIATQIGRAIVDLGVLSLFGALPVQDQYNTSNKILLMFPATLTYGDATTYHSNKIKFEKTARAFASLLGHNESYAKLMAIYEFEVKLAKISSGKTPDAELIEFVEKSIRDKTPLQDCRMTINEFCEQSGFSCPFLKSVLKIAYAGRIFSGNEKLLVTNVTYFKRLYSLYKQTMDAGNVAVISDYIMWRVVREYLEALPSNLSSLITGKSPSTLPRSSTCINQMRTLTMNPLLMPTKFDMSLGLLYVNANFDDTSKKTVEDMTEDLRASFIDRLSSQTWMDSETKEKAKEKALAIKVSIGYPTYIKNPKKLEEHYQSLTVTDEFFQNVVSINHFDAMKLLKSYRKPVDKESWPAGPATVNGAYMPSENRIIYFAGILQSPFYNPEYPRYMQYGAIGMVIGHEITHGFDGSGRKHDKYGNLHNWWSDSADANFKERSSCLVKQYNKYKVFGKKINGTKTLDENIADNGGIKIAYDAYQRWAAQNGTEKILPGLRLSPDQLFFVGFAQPWCSVYSKLGAYWQLLTDGHSYNRYRVIGSLSNFKKFSQAFQCPANSAMNPREKCAVW